MTSAGNQRTEGEASCFSRAVRWIRDALSRICRANSCFYRVNEKNKRTQKSQFCLGRKKNQLGVNHYNNMMYAISLEDSKWSSSVYKTWAMLCDCESGEVFFFPSLSLQDDLHYSSFYSSNCSQSKTVTVSDPTCPRAGRPFLQHNAVWNEQSGERDAFKFQSVRPATESASEHGALVKPQRESVTAVIHSPTNALKTQFDPHMLSMDSSWSGRDSRPSPRSHSVPSLSPATCAETKILTRSQSLPDLKLNSSFEDFTPDISVDEDDETYRFQCSCPGLYQCTVIGLVFHMEGGGDVVYRTVPWNRRQLSQHHKKPAGPLFDIKCDQQSVCQLHVPHCEVLSTGGVHFLSVAHVTDEGIEFIRPHNITETHVVIRITGFSGYGNVKDEDSPPDPVQALVLLFYRPPDDPDTESIINVLLLPKNVSLWDVQRTRKKLVGEERYLETSPHCKLQPNQFYTLSTCPQDDMLDVQPTEAEFDEDSYENYFPSFQVTLETTLKHLKLLLKDTDSSHIVWERQVCLTSNGKRKSCGLLPNQRLLDVRSGFVDSISEPVLKSLLDKLLEKKVITDSERESGDEKQNRRDKARFVMDTVRRKGEAASSEMIDFLCEVDPFLCGHLGLM